MPYSILLVDDERDANEALKMFLELNDFKVRISSSGKEGIAALREAVPDLVLLDLLMPGIDGWETLKQMRQIAPNLRVVILTGSVPDRDLEEQAKQAGAIGIITKPLNLNDLVPTIQGFLQKKGP